jgi:hypothetical protein
MVPRPLAAFAFGVELSDEELARAKELAIRYAALRKHP